MDGPSMASRSPLDKPNEALRHISLYVPPETWERIYFFLDDARDLYSLALTCKTHREAVIPAHLYFRRLSCSLMDEHFWTQSAEQPGYLTRVEWLDLNHRVMSPAFFRTFEWPQPSTETIEFEESDPHRQTAVDEEEATSDLSSTPRQVTTPEETTTPEEIIITASSKALAKAIQRMKYLKRFRADFFSLKHCLDIFVGRLCDPRNCPNLKELDISIVCDLSLTAAIFDLFRPLFLNFTNLTHVVITIFESPVPVGHPAWGTKVLDCLSRNCSSLTKLLLSYQYSDAWDIPTVEPELELAYLFVNGQWPRLSHLTLNLTENGVFIRPINADEGVVEQFFNRHKNLEALLLHKAPEKLVTDRVPSDVIRIPSGSLPCLKALSSSEAIHTIPIDIIARLTFLKAKRITEHDSDYLTNLCSLPNPCLLRTCVTKCSVEIFKKLIKAAPNIEKLSLRIPASQLDKYEAMKPYIDVIPTMQRLTHLAGFTRDLEPTSHAQYLRQLVKVKTLTYVLVTVVEHEPAKRERETWIFLERRSEFKDVYGYHPAEGVPDVSSWGDLFRGLKWV
ncbi:hypothetical protein BU17DRAFT_92032 [Hysterangium stoloniferum]|nr:hypothetical protein BU17DRAFT_92032 [Hysterangium stoloniferum]